MFTSANITEACISLMFIVKHSKWITNTNKEITAFSFVHLTIFSGSDLHLILFSLCCFSSSDLYLVSGWTTASGALILCYLRPQRLWKRFILSNENNFSWRHKETLFHPSLDMWRQAQLSAESQLISSGCVLKTTGWHFFPPASCQGTISHTGFLFSTPINEQMAI